MAEVFYAESAELRAPIERVFAYRIEFMNLPDYNPNVSNLRRVDNGSEPGKGAEYLFDLAVMGNTMESPIRVTECEPNSRIVFETGPGYMAREVCLFSETDAGTRVEFATTLTIPGEIDDATATLLEASGREQVLLELDLMKKNLEG